MRIENAMVDSGKRYGNHKLFNTSVPGLYYTILISNMWSAYGTVTNVSSPEYILVILQNNIFHGTTQAKAYYTKVVTMPTHPANIGL